MFIEIFFELSSLQADTHIIRWLLVEIYQAVICCSKVKARPDREQWVY